MSIKLESANDETLTFSVSSHSRPETHDVYFDINNGWVCTCENHFYRKVECKHITEVKNWLSQPKNYTIVGISYYGILEYDPNMVRIAQNMGTFHDIKNRRMKECNFQQEVKLKV